jgi:uncharacterized membrane protein
MSLPLGADPRPSGRTGAGTPALGGIAVALGGLLAILSGLRRRSRLGLVLAALGGLLVYRGVTGASLLERLIDLRSLRRPRHRLRYGSARERSDGAVAWAVQTIGREREPVYLFWREPGNLALVHDWVEHVTPGDEGRQTWRLKGPGEMRTTVEMATIEDVPLERIAWEAVDPAGAEDHAGADDHAGANREPLRVRVDLRERPGRRETEVVLTARLPAAAGPLGGLLQGVMATVTEAHLGEALRRARQLLETGEMATTEGQPSGRRRTGEQPGLVPVGPGRRDTVPSSIGTQSSREHDPASRGVRVG